MLQPNEDHIIQDKMGEQNQGDTVPEKIEEQNQDDPVHDDNREDHNQGNPSGASSAKATKKK
jgi:hypothetical protein